MKYFHYTSEPFLYDLNRKYEQEMEEWRKCQIKPNGLWLSADTAWEDWCRGEEFNLDALKYKTEVVLNTDDILVIDTADKIEKFNFDWLNKEEHLNFLQLPKWKDLSKHYKGIIIDPYQYEYRLKSNYFWYYGWDCASGCIWDLTCVKEVKQCDQN